MDSQYWDKLVGYFSDPHILQTWEWAMVKSFNGWNPIPIVWTSHGQEYIGDRISSTLIKPDLLSAGALVHERMITIPGIGRKLRIMYVPKGPIVRDWSDERVREQVLVGIRNLASRSGAIFIKIDPDVRLGMGKPGAEDSRELAIGREVQDDLESHGWRFSDEQIQFRNSIMIDLTFSEDELLARMKQKTRYNIRLAARKGVKIRSGSEDDFQLLYKMYAETANRDGFVIRDASYYFNAWHILLKESMAEPLIAEVDGEPVAGLINVYFSGKAWYLFGMSSQRYRERMPNYLLQWTAIQHAMAAGCQLYDLWGAPDTFGKQDPMWGVFRFKEGLGGDVIRHIGAWDLPIHPTSYKLYTGLLPRVLDLMRRRGQANIRKSMTATSKNEKE